MERRSVERVRHGRGPRSDVRGIASARGNGRAELFMDTARDVVEYLHDVQTELMRGVRVDVALLPHGEFADGHPRKWTVIRTERRVVLFRLPIERGSRLHRNDEWHRRNNIETVVFEAIAELIEIDPYDLAPNRYFPHS